MGDETQGGLQPEPAWYHEVEGALQGENMSEGQGSPQRGEILLGEARVLPQLPVGVVAHPGVIF